jgi:hypothetical protein
MLLAGCGGMQTNVVQLTRELNYDSDLTTPVNFHWDVKTACFTSDSRGKQELLVEAPAVNAAKPVYQWLYVRVVWDIHPSASGSDPTAVNAYIGYLVQTEPGRPNGKTLYYEGMGNVYTDRPNWLGGRRRFTIRHAALKLTRSNRDESVDPFGRVWIDASIAAGVDPDAGERIAPIARLIDTLPPPSPAPPKPTTTTQDASVP